MTASPSKPGLFAGLGRADDPEADHAAAGRLARTIVHAIETGGEVHPAIPRAFRRKGYTRLARRIAAAIARAEREVEA